MKFINPLVLALTMAMLFACSQSPIIGNDSNASAQNAAAPSIKIKNSRKKPSVPSQAIKDYQPAIAAMDARQWQKAEALLREMSVRYPRLMSVRVNLAIAYRQQQRPEEAIAELKTVVAYKAIYRSDAHNLLAIMYREGGDFSAAETLYLDAIQQWPTDASLPRNLGILYDLYLDQPEQALNAYQQANALLAEPDKALKRWIKSLERKLKAAVKPAKALSRNDDGHLHYSEAVA